MMLSNNLFERVAVNLKLETLRLVENKVYANQLLKKIFILQELKKKNYKNLNTKVFYENNNINHFHEDFCISYIISICFLKANTTIHLSDAKGNLKLFYSSGLVSLQGKQKKKRAAAIAKLISLLSKHSGFVGTKPVAVHLHNVVFQKSLVINKLKRLFFVKLVKSFNTVPFNGCRKKKIRRKKYVRNIKK